MRVILHSVPDNVGDFVEPAVIFLVQCVQDPPLDRLQAVFELRNRPVPDYVGCVLDEVVVNEVLQWIFGQVQ